MGQYGRLVHELLMKALCMVTSLSWRETYMCSQRLAGTHKD